jgi:succinoglycan biosynthesis transport protein ExoP
MKVSGIAEATESTLTDLVVKVRDTVRRRWLVLVLVAAAIFAIGVALILLMTPVYTATATVRIDPTRSALGNEASAVALTLTPEAIETEVSLIQSSDLARSVIEKLRLDHDPEFTKAVDKAPAGSMTKEERMALITSAVLSKLNVSRDKLTYLLKIRYTSRNAATAARIANAFAEAYVYAKVGSKVDNSARKGALLRQQFDQLGQEIRAADAQVAQYRASAGISQSSVNGAAGSTIVDQEIAPLSQQLAQAESEAAAAQAQFRAAQAQAARGGADSDSGVLASPVVTELRRQRAEVLRSMGEVQARYSEKHPEAIRVRDQLERLDQQLAAEQRRILASLSSAADAANARAASLRKSLGTLAEHQADNTRKSVLADSIAREADTKRAQYERLSQLVLDSSQASNNTISQAVIVDSAQVPSAPSAPNKPLLLTLAIIVALAAGSGTIAVQELLVTGMRTVADIEQGLELELLASVPVVNSPLPADLLLERPTSAFAEALRLARASILGVKRDDVPQIIALTSALPAEGKTTTALAFARTLAMNGAKTLLIECDVRRAVMRHSVKHPSDGPGIVEVLHGEATVDEAIHPGDLPGMEQLLVQAPYFSSEDLFGDGRMAEILESLRGRYTHIVLDLPPLIGLADGRFIAALADTVALIVRWNSTPLSAASLAANALKTDNVPLAGAIYTMVDKAADVVGALYNSKKYYSYYQAT